MPLNSFSSSFSNTCYIESILIILSFIFYDNSKNIFLKELEIENIKNFENKEDKHNLTSSFLFVIKYILGDNNIDKKYIKTFIRNCEKNNLYNGTQEDALYFLENLIEILHKEKSVNPLIKNYLELFCIGNIATVEGKKIFFDKDIETGFRSYIYTPLSSSSLSTSLKEKFCERKDINIPLIDEKYCKVEKLKLYLFNNNKYLFFNYKTTTQSFLLEEKRYIIFCLLIYIGNGKSGHYASCLKIENKWFLFDGELKIELKEYDKYIENSVLLGFRKE